MLRRLFLKWFGLEELPCNTCEVLRAQLDESNRERRELLNRLLEPPKSEPPSTEKEEFHPIQPQFKPWRVRQQMFEEEDRKKAQLMKERTKDIEKLEKELHIVPEVNAAK